LAEPVLLKTSVSVPTAVFCVPVGLSKSATAPTAVLELALLRGNAPAPTPVLKLPVVSKKSDRQPNAVFPPPPVTELSPSHPAAVVKLGKHPSGAGLIARAPGKSAKQVNTARMAVSIVFRFFIFLISFRCLAVSEVSLFKVCLQSLWWSAYASRAGRSLSG